MESGDWPDDPETQGLGAWSNYTGAGYREMNDDLRAGKENRWNDAFEHFFSGKHAERLPQNAILYRGIRNPHGWDPATIEPGEVLSEPGWVSTSAHEDHTVGKWLLRIKAPKGTPFVRGLDHEREVILRRGQRFRVIGVDRKNRELVVELIT